MASGGSSAIRAGRAFVEFFGKDTQLTRTIELIKNRLTELGQWSLKIGTGLAGFGTAILAPLMALFTAAAERGRIIKQLSDQFGTTTESISGLAAGFEGAGIGLESFGSTLDSVSAKILNNDELLRQLGVNTMALRNADPTEQLAAIADGLARVTNPATQAQLAMEILGAEVGKRLLPYLRQGAKGIAELKDEFKDFRLDPETAKRGEQTMRGLNQIWTQFKLTLLEVGSALLPNVESIKNIVVWIREAGLGIKNWINQNKETIKVVALVGAVLVAAGTAFIAFGTAALGVATAIGGVSAVIGGLVTGVSTLIALWPVLLGGFLVAGAIYSASLLGNFQALAGSMGILKNMFAGLGETAKSTWDIIGQAISKGDLNLAFQTAIAGIQLGWAQMVDGLTNIWNKFKESFVDGWHGVATAVQLILLEIGGFAIKALLSGIQLVLDMSARALHAVGAHSLAVAASGALKDQGLTPDFIDSETEKKKNAILDRSRDDQAKRNESRKADSDSAHDEVERKKKELDDLKKRAEEGGFEGGFHQDSVPSRNDIMGLASSVKGGFGGQAAAQQFGVGDKVGRLIEGINGLGIKMDAQTAATKEIGTALRLAH